MGDGNVAAWVNPAVFDDAEFNTWESKRQLRAVGAAVCWHSRPQPFSEQEEKDAKVLIERGFVVFKDPAVKQ